MTGSQVVHGVQQELDDAVFTLRMAVPLSWQGPAATAFTEQLEETAGELARISTELHTTVALLRWQEQHLRAVSSVLGWGG